MPFNTPEKRAAYYQKNKARKNQKSREYYKANREKCIEQARQQREANICWYKAYKSTLSCIKCGENFPECLHFHHRDPDSKQAESGLARKRSRVGDMAARGVSIKRLKEEIAKCDVLCSNCHIKEHARLKMENPDPDATEARREKARKSWKRAKRTTDKIPTDTLDNGTAQGS